MRYRRGTETLVPHVIQKGHRDPSPTCGREGVQGHYSHMWYRRGTGTLVPHVVEKGYRDTTLTCGTEGAQGP